MHFTHSRIKYFILFSILLSTCYSVKAQVNAADSLWFTQLFNQTKYADDSAFQGNWYIHDSVHTIPQLFAQLDSSFKYTFEDFKNIDSMVVNDTIFFDTVRNNTYNSYTFVFQQNNPLISVDYSLNGKANQAYSYFYPKDSSSMADCAFLILPGNGNNESTAIVQGIGYSNLICYVTNQLKQRGDVFTYIKPNEDARAIYNHKSKLNHSYMVSYLDSVKHPYGVNYLTEAIATIKLLKKKYCKVVVLGLSEGGYAGLLASLITHPDAAMISAGYSIGFDTSWSSYSILQQRFDSLVFTYDRATIKNNIVNHNTKYLFTWGDNDQINLMQQEHDSSYTQLFFNDSINCSYYYNYELHAFPSCAVIDSFAHKMLSNPKVNFTLPFGSNPDSLSALISNCGIASYSFDLFKNDTFYHSFSGINFDTLVTLIDSGKYHLQNIVNVYGDSVSCNDTIFFHKISQTLPNYVKNFEDQLKVYYNNPVAEQLHIKLDAPPNKTFTYKVYDISGREKINTESKDQSVVIDVHSLPSGIYFLQVNDGAHRFKGKVIKL